MDVLFLSRLQFALTVGFHYIFPTISIGLGVILVIMEGMYLKTNNELYHNMTRFWVKIFGLTFAIGVATGIVMEFEFGTNWAVYSRYVGDVFGSALAAEGVFAFFLESGFLAILLFGWDRVSKKMHFVANGTGGLRSPFQCRLDCSGQFLAADPGRVSHRWQRYGGPGGNTRLLGDGLQSLLHGSAVSCTDGILAGGGLVCDQCERLLPVEEEVWRLCQKLH